MAGMELMLMGFEQAVPFATRPEITGAVVYEPRDALEDRQEVPADEVYYADGWFTLRNDPSSKLRFTWVAIPRNYWKDGWRVDVLEPDMSYHVHDRAEICGDYAVFACSPERQHESFS